MCERVTFLDRIPEVQNGYVVDKTREYYYGDEARVQCYKGYRLIGSHTVKCNEQQDFSNVPVCEGRRSDRWASDRDAPMLIATFFPSCRY